MNAGIVFRALGLILLIVAALLAYSNYEKFANGEMPTFAYAMSFAGPLIISIVMQIFARNASAGAGDDTDA